MIKPYPEECVWLLSHVGLHDYPTHGDGDFTRININPRFPDDLVPSVQPYLIWVWIHFTTNAQ